MKVTIAIPNFNGEKSLKENLPDIVSSGADEVLIIDDRSFDSSVEVIETYPSIKLHIHKNNLGFVRTVNELFNLALGDIVVLLNNDVGVNKGFLSHLTPHFSDEKIFAVNCHEEGEGWPVASWKEGFFQWGRGIEGREVHRSAWASGGSAAYRKDVWHSLGGFDEIYTPGYWEDIDISYRAIGTGFHILWEPKAKVLHKHGTIMQKVFRKRYIQWIKDRNQLLFIWKNITDQKLLTDHRVSLLKRLLGGMSFGYWIPYLMALSKKPLLKKGVLSKKITDLEIINYANE